MKKKKPIIAVTMGDPAGIGPEIVMKAFTRHRDWRASFLVIGDAFVMNETAKTLGYRKKIGTATIFSSTEKAVKNGRCPYLIDLKNVDRKNFRFGQTDASCGKAAIEYINKAVDLIKVGAADALVTAPISKEAINLAGFNWPGHTEYLAYLSDTKRFCMMLAGGPLRVVLATRHIALKDICKRLNSKEIYEAIALTYDLLKKQFRIKDPKIAVSALNPHAGEGGLFSDEEKRVILPAIKKAAGASIKVIGPLAADSLFYHAYRGAFDAEIVMYHDQGLIPLKMIARDSAVNITLGLPFVRTSPAHGTAFDIAGKNKANPSSMIEAIRMARRLVATVT